MSRLKISAVLLLLCLGVSIYAHIRVGQVYDDVNQFLDQTHSAMAREDAEQTEEHVNRLSAYWDKEEDRLIHILRHSQIDDMSKSVARLRALVAGGDCTELSAELDSIRWQMEHIYRSERFFIQNVLKQAVKTACFPCWKRL